MAAQLCNRPRKCESVQEINDLKNRLERKRSLYLESEIQRELHFEEIVGKSEVLKRVLNQVSTVARAVRPCLFWAKQGPGKN